MVFDTNFGFEGDTFSLMFFYWRMLGFYLLASFTWFWLSFTKFFLDRAWYPDLFDLFDLASSLLDFSLTLLLILSSIVGFLSGNNYCIFDLRDVYFSSTKTRGDFTKDSDYLSKVRSRFFGAKDVFGVKFCWPNFCSSITRYYYCVKEGLYLGKS